MISVLSDDWCEEDVSVRNDVLCEHVIVRTYE